MEKINPDWQKLQHPRKEQGRQRERESYPLSGDLAQPPAADTTDRRAHMALQLQIRVMRIAKDASKSR